MKNYLGGALVAFAASMLSCWLLIPILRRMKAGQNILSYVKEHSSKGGTPTFGGLAFIPAAVLSSLPFLSSANRPFIVASFIGVAYMLVGFLDDVLKKKHRDNLGLTAWQKLAFQTLVAIMAGVYCALNGFTVLNIPFFKITVDIGWWMLPLSVFVFLATVNAVNLTDGLDGLAAGVSLPYFLFIGLLIVAGGTNQELSVLCFCLVGALAAYLVFNTNKASVFMGDTGSLALGGFVASISLFSGNALYIPVVGIMFVFTIISVVVQVIYYKATGGKRIFLMSPAHHHFQQKGYAESKIAYTYSIVTAALGTLCLLMKL
ncbi:MAG: phospho-N-acetylmuramoyl-pentapeptide-transferase [Clostridia bacterium]|nr:phospho-N-acetylmuramoyl-pentapeptide-transferase [Clostridia bacterium]